MNLKKLVGLKNINPQGTEPWAYQQHGVGEKFQLEWRNANGLEWEDVDSLDSDDLLLLIQHGLITHIVEVCDTEAVIDNKKREWNLSRTVKTLWLLDFKAAPETAKAVPILGKSAIRRNGKVHPMKFSKELRDALTKQLGLQ